MKKIILTLALAVATATASFAQLSVGAGYLNNTSKTGNSTSSTAGFHAGLDFDYNLVGGLSVVPGVHFAYLGAKDTGAVGNLATGSVELKETYLTIPVNVKYEVNLMDAIGLFAFAGPQFNLGLSSTQTASGSVLGVGGSTSVNNYGENSNYNRFDIALGLGVGMDVADMVRISFSYNLGLLDRNASDNVTTKNNYWQVGAAFLF